MEIYGKFNSCIIYTDNYDDATYSQLFELMRQEFIKGEKIRIMPDCHAGSGCVIGTTMTLKNKKVCPSLVGVDIGCGMLACKVKERDIDFEKLDNIIRTYIPSGTNIHKVGKKYNLINEIIAPFDKDYALKSIGSLGGGNHFIEVDKDKSGNLWIVIHSGSRHLGKEVCTYYQNLAYEKLKEKANGGLTYKQMSDDLINKLKSEGRSKEIQKELEKLSQKYKNTRIEIPKELAYLEGQYFMDYIHDMEIVQQYASDNRRAMMSAIISHMGLTAGQAFETIHNYIDCENMIMRKGAISAQDGELVIIPMNMRDGSLICVGKGNEDWNFSAPHGAGRIMSRAEAKEVVSLEEYEESMQGIYTTSVGLGTIDESPMVYKPIEEIVQNIKDTVRIIDVIKPVYNFKAN